MNDSLPVVGIGACLVGHKVRYSGDAKRRNSHISALGEHVEMRPFCPEVAIGLGTPREPVRLVGDLGEERLTDSATQQADYSAGMKDYARRVVENHPELAGYVLVKASPSCGMERVKRYNDKGNFVLNDATGLFAREVASLDPLLPMEEDGRLNDPYLRENFVSRVFAYHHWKQFLAEQPVTHHRLTTFWSSYKYLMMSRHVPTYKEIGRTLADANDLALEDTQERFATLLMQGLARVATRKSNTNVLQHLRGYLKRRISKDDKREIDALISDYHSGQVPLVVPLTLLRHYFRLHPSRYIEQQVYLQPYPEKLSLRNMV